MLKNYVEISLLIKQSRKQLSARMTTFLAVYAVTIRSVFGKVGVNVFVHATSSLQMC